MTDNKKSKMREYLLHHNGLLSTLYSIDNFTLRTIMRSCGIREWSVMRRDRMIALCIELGYPLDELVHKVPYNPNMSIDNYACMFHLSDEIYERLKNEQSSF